MAILSRPYAHLPLGARTTPQENVYIAHQVSRKLFMVSKAGKLGSLWI